MVCDEQNPWQKNLFPRIWGLFLFFPNMLLDKEITHTERKIQTTTKL